jgi:hypothetical protein
MDVTNNKSSKQKGKWAISFIPCQFRSVSFGMTKTFHTNSKNGTKRNKFHLILNLGSFWIFWLNSARNVPVSFHMFRSALEKPLNQIEPCSISLIKPPNYKKNSFSLLFSITMILIIILKIIITIFIKNDINFLKLDLSLIYMVYIHVVVFHVYTM